MVSLSVYDNKGKTAGTIEAADKIFGVELKESVIHDAVSWHLASLRQGTSSTKTRAEVRGGGKKPWKQKGTGRARAGTIRSPLWRGGGVTFGPKPRDYSFALPKKVRKLAIRMALSDRIKAGLAKVVDSISVKTGKTKEMAVILDTLGIKNALMVIDSATDKEKRAVANIEKIKLVSSKNVSVFDILNYEGLILDREAVKNLEERL